MGRWRTVALGAWLALVATAGAAAGEPPAAKDPPATLRARVDEFERAARSLVAVCKSCGGGGLRYRFTSRGEAMTSPCSDCGELGGTVSESAARSLFFDLRTPAWRARPSSEDDALDLFLALRPKDEESLAWTKWRFGEIELIDDDHAVARTKTFISEKPVRRPKDQAWVRLEGVAGGAPSWFLWSPATDGPWPGKTPPPPTEPVRGSLSTDGEKAVREALKGAATASRVVGLQRFGARLIVRLERSDKPEKQRRDREDSVDTFRIAFALAGVVRAWDYVWIEFLVPHAGPGGATADKSYLLVSVTQAQVLRLAEPINGVTSLPERHEVLHPGWTPIGK